MPHAEFGTDRKYVIRATLSGIGVDLGSLDADAVENLISEIGSQFAFRSRSGGRFREDVAWTLPSVLKAIKSDDPVEADMAWFTSNDWLTQRLKSAKENGFNVATVRAAAMWWAVTRLAAKRLARREGREHVNVWTTVFRRLGIDFVYDPGFGIIHTAEPEQIVSFDPRIVHDAELEELRSRPQLQPMLFKFVPAKYRFREDAKTGVTAKQRIEKEGVRPCESVQLIIVDPDSRSYTRHVVNVGDVVAFLLPKAEWERKEREDISVGFRVHMILHDKVLVSLVRADGAPLSSAELARIGEVDFRGEHLLELCAPTFLDCHKFAEIGINGFDDMRTRVIEHAVVPDADFRGANLSNIKFSYCYFPRALFSYAKLQRADFRGCYLRGADFTHTNADIIKVVLDDGEVQQLSEASSSRQPYFRPDFWPSDPTMV
jgi:hypothetical protein